MLARVRMVALHGVCHGAALAVATAQLRSDDDLHLLEPGFLVGANEPELEELIGDFTAATEAIMAATRVGDIVLTTFFDP